YEYLDDLTNADLVKATTKRVDEVRRMTYAQSRSYDEIVELSKNNKKRLEHIPAIQPVFNKDLKYMASGYGRRIDPVYHTPKFHAGMDFAAPTGTKIFATGDGKVTLAEWKQGYGKCVIISHGYGYETLYGHMHDFNVREGQEVRRGDVIGYVGSTGKSTGSHLHYEVHVNGSPVNPQNYYYADLSPEEYDRMLQLTANNAKVFD
ncbi:MAG: M23 family metallopeptidase, partial [Paludibacteraceae bacterium]|nr:M23 family metallopeptidase [Paludibacteraceae bacterium]